MNCPQCESEHYIYVEKDEQLGCLDCGYRPKYYGIPPHLKFQDENRATLDALVQKWIDADHWGKLAFSWEIESLLGLKKPTDADLLEWLKTI